MQDNEVAITAMDMGTLRGVTTIQLGCRLEPCVEAQYLRERFTCGHVSGTQCEVLLFSLSSPSPS